jgi:hypothetical protein
VQVVYIAVDASRTTGIFGSFLVETRSKHASSNFPNMMSHLNEPAADLIIIMYQLTGTPATAARLVRDNAVLVIAD